MKGATVSRAGRRVVYMSVSFAAGNALAQATPDPMDPGPAESAETPPQPVDVADSLEPAPTSETPPTQPAAPPVQTAEPDEPVMMSSAASPTEQLQSAAEKRRRADASIDRNILMPTAETVGEGEATFNSYELLLAGFTYGLSDDFAVSATVLLPVFEETPWLISAAGKFRVLAASNDIFSVQPSITYFFVDDEYSVLLGGTLLYDHLFDDEGRYTLTLAANALGVLGTTSGDVGLSHGALLGFSSALNAHVGSFVKLMAEFYLPATLTEQHREVLQEGLLFNYGVRFFGQSIAADLTFLRPIHPDVDSPVVMGVPFVTFSARF